MNTTITEVRPASAKEWDDIWKNCDYSTYFHSREWAEIWQKYTHGKMRPAAKLIRFSDSKTILLPFSSQRILKGVAKQYISSPAGTFGGWLSKDDLSEFHKILLYKYIKSHYYNLIWRLNPYNRFENSSQIEISEKDETQVLNLECGFEAIHKNWTMGHSSTARKARKARKAGVKIRKASKQNEWKSYYALYEDSIKRWGKAASSQYGWHLFDTMFNRSSPNINLWLATYDEKIIAGSLCFYAKRHVVYWHGSALSEYFKLRPVNLLMFEIIKNSCEQGYRRFDFNPSGGHEGVKKFKKSFGTITLESPIIKNESTPVKIFKLLKQQHIRR